jgi:ribonuclease R
MYVEGLVHITELGGEYYRFDEARQELRGERTGLRYALGTRVRVQVSRVDLDGRRIDFRLVQEGEALLSRPVKDKDSLREGHERTLFDADTDSLSSGRRSRKISEPLARAPKPKQSGTKPAARPAAAKNKDKGRKTRRRS